MTTPHYRSLNHTEVAEQLDENKSSPWVYLDVRTPEEFEQGHINGAYNIPYKLGDVAGLHPNPEFVALVRATFATDTPLILGCRSGARAADAAQPLHEAGYRSLAVHVGSLAGAKDAFGRQQPGWTDAGYPTSSHAAAGRTYAELKTRAQAGPSARPSET